MEAIYMDHLQQNILSPLEISPATAAELRRVGIGEIIDVRQPFEIEAGAAEVPGAESLPLYNLKGILGHALSEEEAEIAALELAHPQALLQMLNAHRARGTVLLCLCRSGNRSREAAQLLRTLGYGSALSIAGGIQGWQAAGLEVLAV